MAKELEKFQKEAAALDKQADQCLETVKKTSTNLNHFMEMFQQGCMQVGETVQKLKSQGKTGSKYDDFKNEQEVKTVVQAMEDIRKNYTRNHKEFEDAKAKAAKVVDEYAKLQKTIEGEISSRKKKKDRKILAVDSKSLPEMEKLVESVKKKRLHVRDEAAQAVGFDKPDAIWKRTLKNIDFEVGRTKDDRDAQLQAELDRRGLDIRVAQRNLGVAGKLANEIQTACDATQGKDADKAKALLTLATKKLKELKALDDQYKRAIGGVEQSAREAMQTKDGKFLISLRNSISKLYSDAENLIKATLKQAK